MCPVAPACPPKVRWGCADQYNIPHRESTRLDTMYVRPSDEADHKQWCNFDILGSIRPLVCAEKGNRGSRTHGDGVIRFGAEGA